MTPRCFKSLEGFWYSKAFEMVQTAQSAHQPPEQSLIPVSHNILGFSVIDVLRSSCAPHRHGDSLRCPSEQLSWQWCGAAD
jgi:hypothetical protein